VETIDVALPSKDLQAAIAVNRFGLGARPGDLDAARGDPRSYLLAQIGGSALIPTGVDESSAQRVTEYRDFVAERRAAQQAGDPKTAEVTMARRDLRQDANGDFLARAQLGADTSDGFRERWALFFANHFTVSGIKQQTATLVAPFEQEAIRPHVFGRFEDMLAASSSHPGMLLYLDQAQSTGPDSLAAQRAKGRAPGLNENLAREIMELHTVGVEAGYSQADVTEFARAMTGWSIARQNEPGGEGAFRFRPQAHEPGARTIMGRRYAEGGVEQARAVMKDLAASPHTAQHLARKLGQHFVADDPPPTLTARLAKAYLDNDGRLDVVARTLVNSPEAWDPQPRKFKTPYEFMISSWRATGQRPLTFQRLGPPLNALGQNPAGAPSPKGWPDTAGDWSAPDALIKRMTWSQGFAAQAAGSADPNQTARLALGAQLTPAVATAVSRAESRPEAVALLLMSPEFQRR
jgi:uncharacterized protein (DUF1800 family)